MIEQAGTKVSTFHTITSYNLKANRKPLLQNCHHMASLQFIAEQENNLNLYLSPFGEIFSGLMKHKINCVVIMAIVVFGEKEGRPPNIGGW